MDKVSRRFIIAICLLLAESAWPQSTKVDWVRGTDFRRFATFTWATGAFPINDRNVQLGIGRLVRAELEAKGLKHVSAQEKFDAFVTYDARLIQNPSKSTETDVAINIRIFDSKDNSVIWSGGGYVAFTKDDALNRRYIQTLLDSIFQKYPPSE